MRIFKAKECMVGNGFAVQWLPLPHARLDQNFISLVEGTSDEEEKQRLLKQRNAW